jgi:hypothetical protein
MKKILLFTTLFLALNFCANAQFEVRDGADNLITDGQTMAFSDGNCGYNDPCNWKFKVTNTAGNDIYMKIYCDATNNTNGENFQLCFAEVCLNSVEAGQGYPSTAALIPQGATNAVGNSMWNLNDTGSSEMSWAFRFQELNAAGDQIGTPLTMTYAFDPNLSANDFNKVNVSLYPTVADNELNITTQEPLELVIYNLLGKKIKDIQVKSGTSVIDISALSSQPYLLRFTNNNNQQLTKKIVVK